MLNEKGLEAAWLAHDNACPGEHWRKKDRMASAITAYLQAVGPEPAVADREKLNSAVDAVFAAVIDCPHEIEAESITLRFSPNKGGHNALFQLSGRIRSALVATPPAEPVMETNRRADINRLVDYWSKQHGETAKATAEALSRLVGLFTASSPMADGGEFEMTAAEDVLAWLLIEKIGVPDDQSYTPNQAQEIIAAALATPPAVKDDEPVVEEWREIEQHVQPRLADGYTAVAISKPGFWMVKGPGPAAALATKPAVKGDETLVEAPYGWVYFNEDTGTEWSESHPVRSGEVPDATEIRPCGEHEKPWIDELLRRDEQLFHFRPLVEAARTFLTSPNIVKLTVNGKRMTPQEVVAALAAKDGRS